LQKLVKARQDSAYTNNCIFFLKIVKVV